MEQIEFNTQEPETFYSKFKAAQPTPQPYLEALFLVGKFSEDPNLKEEIEGILAAFATKGTIKAYRSRTKISASLEYDKRIKAMISFAKKSEELDIGKMFSLLGRDDLLIFNRSPLNKEPEFLGRFNGVTKMFVSGGFPDGIPEEIGELTSLEEIELYQNGAKRLPDSFAKLVNLKTLELRITTLEEIPIALKDLPNLSHLRIEGSHYDYTPTHFKIPSWLGEMPALRTLELTYLQEQTLPETVFSPELEHIRLAQLTQLRSLPASLSNCTQLKSILIATSNQVTELPLGMENISSLEEIEIVNMKGLKKLNGDFLYGPNVRNLKLSGLDVEIYDPQRRVKEDEALTIQNAKYLEYVINNAELFPKLTALKIFNIKELGAIEGGVGNLTGLKSIYLSEMGDFPGLLADVGKCSLLEEVTIFNSAIQELPASFAHLTTLKRLHIANASNLPLHFSTLPLRIGHLKLSNLGSIEIDNLQPKVIHSLEMGTSPLLNLENIGSIDCTHLSLSSIGYQKEGPRKKMKELPPSLNQMKNLETCELYGTFSSVPNCFSDLPKLKELRLHGTNYSTDYFPIERLELELDKMPALKHLTIDAYAGDQLEQILAPASQLEEIELSKIEKLKFLPPLSQHPGLKKLTIENCDAFLSLKHPLSSLHTLKVYMCKNVQRDLLREISEMTTLENVDLSYLSDQIDEIPESWVFLKSLVLQSLNITQLPANIDQFTKLHTLGLDYLSFYTLPKSMAALKNLKRMSINGHFDHFPEELRALELDQLRYYFSKFAGNNIPKRVYSVLVNTNTRLVREFDGREYF